MPLGGGELSATLRRMHPTTRQAVMVVDAGMFSHDHLTHLEHHGRTSVGRQDIRVGVFRRHGCRIVVSTNQKRAHKDAHGRNKALRKLVRRLKKSRAPEQHLGNRGAHRYVRIVGDSHTEMDEEKIKAAKAWDGLRGAVTHLKGVSVSELFNHDRQLWQMEESFRITQHDPSSTGLSNGSDRIAPTAPRFKSIPCRHR